MPKVYDGLARLTPCQYKFDLGKQTYRTYYVCLHSNQGRHSLLAFFESRVLTIAKGAEH